MQKINDRLLNWASDIDTNTILQAERTARLPIVEGHVALMPDAHLGVGATVGSVIPTKGAIIPAAVGVDIGCVDANSEYLGRVGWRRIADYQDGDEVMQYDPATGFGEFVKPSQFIKREETSFLHFRTKYGIDQMLTLDHRVLCWTLEGRERRQVQTVVSALEFAERHHDLVLGNKALFETTFEPQLPFQQIMLTDDELRIMVMVMADGHIDQSGACTLRFKKDRKIQRAKELLHKDRFTTGQTSDGVTWFRFTPPRPDKSYRWCWTASFGQLLVIVDEVFHWDGNADERCFYTRDEESADFMQYAFTATGSRGVKRADECRDGKIDYRVYAHNNTRISMGGVPRTDIIEVPSFDGYAYCFTVPSGFWVMRRGGNVVMTGNCGMVATETNLLGTELPDNFDKFLKIVEKTVPAGMGEGHHRAGRVAENWMRSNRPQSDLDTTQERNALKQFGSLGGGNHFVEVCLDEREVVWIVLHSGSRGIGNKLAQAHIKKAKKVCKDLQLTLEDPDLAYFVQNTPEFDHYIADMLWAQDYALANQQAMIDNLLPEFFKFVGKGKVIKTINCHHNFTQRETFDEQELWITRKGAIQADVGDLGVIPGSMGTKSYIVEGLGNPLSWNSCSHGAGRRMSRSQAKRDFTVDDLAKQMTGKIWLEDRAQALLDEIPSSYKSIDQVMADQADLVKIQHTLHQVLNFKGA